MTIKARKSLLLSKGFRGEPEKTGQFREAKVRKGGHVSCDPERRLAVTPVLLALPHSVTSPPDIVLKSFDFYSCLSDELLFPGTNVNGLFCLLFRLALNRLHPVFLSAILSSPRPLKSRASLFRRGIFFPFKSRSDPELCLLKYAVRRSLTD